MFAQSDMTATTTAAATAAAAAAVECVQRLPVMLLLFCKHLQLPLISNF
jgi:hypothetical protein